MNYKIAGWLVAVGVVGLMVLYVKEFDYIGNTIGYRSLVWRSLGVALGVGLYLGWRWQNRGKDRMDGIRIWIASVLFALFFAPLAGSLTNRMLARGGVVYKTFEFIEEHPFASSAYGFLEGEEIAPEGCYLFVFYEGKIRRLKRPACEFGDKVNGDKITLPVRTGLWGYEIVERN
ncbi:MAG TPA: hypothetical protein ENJ20_05540 [Bacteroidetes bacterium]|nr:hypothetical protein [Bacteroidota bacterium]